MVNVGTGTSGTRFIKTKYPSVTGLVAGTTKQTGRRIGLVPYTASKITERLRRGLNGKR